MFLRKKNRASTSRLKRVLIFCHMSTFFTELFREAILLQKSNNYEPMFLFRKYPTLSNDLKECLKENIFCIDENGTVISAMSEVNTEKKIITTEENLVSIAILRRSFTSKNVGLLPSFIKKPLKFVFLRLAKNVKTIFASDALTLIHELKELKKKYVAIFKIYQPHLLLLAGDQVGNDTPFLIKVAHNFGVAAIITPSTMTNGLEEREVYSKNPRHYLNNSANRLAGFLFPSWVIKYKGRKLIRVPGARVFAFEWLGVSPPAPWTFHSGFADCIAVESNAMLDYYLKAGLPSEKLKLTGSPVYDSLAQFMQNKAQLREKLYERMDLKMGKPLIVSALPPDSLYMVGGRPECDFQKYDELVEFWLKSLGSIRGYNVVISLHPSVDFDSSKHLEKFGVRIAKENIVHLIPLCDIFVASVSSTIRWAIACGKPVLNYDIYRYKYTDFNEVPGVLRVEEQTDFLKTLEQLAYDKKYYSDTAYAQAACSGYWGCLDGKAGNRILELIEKFEK